MAGAKHVFVKIVVTDACDVPGLDEVASRLAAIDRRIPMIIQPVSATYDILPPGPESLLRMAGVAQARLDDVRIIPQMHRVMGML